MSRWAPQPAIERVLNKIERVTESGCWIWLGTGTSEGYGTVGVGSKPDGTRRKAYVHRVTFEHYRGPLQKGLQLDHLCHVTCCANPWHLRQVTGRENTLAPGSQSVAARNATRTHCKMGHPLSESNLYRRPRGNGHEGRGCRACRNVAEHTFLARKHADR